MLKKILLIGVFVLTSHVAYAGLLLEPYLGYESGSFSVETAAGAKGDATTKGMSFGGRAAVTFPMMFVGVDYQTGTTDALFDGDSTSETYTRKTLYLVAGARTPMGLRLFAGYGLMNSLTYKIKSLDSNAVFSGGTTFKAGLGYQFIKFLALNVEYISRTYTTLKIDSFPDFGFKDFYKKFDDSGVFLSLSVPLEI